MRDAQEVAAGCTRFLNYHRPRTVRDRVKEIGESPLSLVRNDGYGRGGYLSEFEGEIAGLLGKEAAVFMPSGTMAQQIAMRIWSDRAGFPRIAFHPTCHLYIHEQMGYRELHHLEEVLVGAPDRLITLPDVQRLPESVSTLLLELPQREIGGQLPAWEELTAQCETARAKGMKLHMDGARLWECRPFYARTYAEIAAPFDSVYVSVYKILNGFPGALLAGPADFIEEARIWQRRHGGNLQQQSPSAIAAKIGLERELPRIPTYVAKAREIAAALSRLDRISILPPVPPTNMMHVTIAGDPDQLVQAALQVADEEKVGLFFRLTSTGMFELTVADAALEVETPEIARLFRRVLELAPVPA